MGTTETDSVTAPENTQRGEIEGLRAANEDLRLRLDEAEETLHAIRTGAVDAFIVGDPDDQRVYTIQGADRPYRLFVEQMQQAAATLQPDGTIAYCNRQLAELLGTPHERMLGREMGAFVADEDRRAYADLFRTARSGPSRGEVHLRRACGQLVPASLSFGVLPEDCGVAIGVLVTDLSSQRALAHAQRMAAVGTLASGLAHDINNVLLAFSGRIESAQLAPGLSRATQSDLVVIAALIDYLRQMARNLSLFARDPQREGIEGCTHLGQWAHKVSVLIDGSLKPGLGQPSYWIKTEWEVAESLPPVGIAPHRLTQVVMNLVHNSRDAVLVKAGPDPAGRLAGCISIRARARPGAVQIEVADDGCGMSDEVRRRSVEPFFTTRDRPESPGGAGTGMGLSLAIEIIRRAGGEVDIDSEPGRGTTITLTLPAVADPASNTHT